MTRSRITIGTALLMLALSGLAQDERARETDRNLFAISYEPDHDPVSINRIHNWVVHVETPDGVVVDNATISIVGSMPGHPHGLPTMPQTTRYLGDGNYLLEGVKFHMNGWWQVTITIKAAGSEDAALFELNL